MDDPRYERAVRLGFFEKQRGESGSPDNSEYHCISNFIDHCSCEGLPFILVEHFVVEYGYHLYFVTVSLQDCMISHDREIKLKLHQLFAAHAVEQFRGQRPTYNPTCKGAVVFGRLTESQARTIAFKSFDTVMDFMESLSATS